MRTWAYFRITKSGFQKVSNCQVNQLRVSIHRRDCIRCNTPARVHRITTSLQDCFTARACAWDQGHRIEGLAEVQGHQGLVRKQEVAKHSLAFRVHEVECATLLWTRAGAPQLSTRLEKVRSERRGGQNWRGRHKSVCLQLLEHLQFLYQLLVKSSHPNTIFLQFVWSRWLNHQLDTVRSPPPHGNSPHQDYYIFIRVSELDLYLPVLLGRGYTPVN